VLSDDGQLNIVLEFAEEGSLEQRLKREGRFTEPTIASYLVQILQGLCYLHSKSIVHCDLKCANILVTASKELKLSDFGVSRSLHEGKLMQQVTGTPNWMSPEAIEMKDDITTAADIW
jgi:serine/threonine protein kinase